MCLRYEVEFTHALVLLAVIGIMGLERALAGQPVWRRAARCGWGLLLIFSAAFNVFANLDLQAYTHSTIGQAFAQHGRRDEAIEQYQKALQINPDFPEAHNSLGVALLQQGKVDDAIGHFEKVLEIKPDSEQAHRSLGNALLQKGRLNEAIAHYQKALELKPDDVQVLSNLAWILATCPQAALRNGNKAVELAEQANALAGGKNPVLLGVLAAAYAEAGRFSEAVETAQHALRRAEAQSNTGLTEALQSELKLYRAGNPFHNHGQTH